MMSLHYVIFFGPTNMTSLLPDMPEPFLSQQGLVMWFTNQPNWCRKMQGQGIEGYFEVPRSGSLRLTELGFQNLGSHWYSDCIKRKEPLTGSEMLTLNRVLQSPWWLSRQHRHVELHCFSRRAHMEWVMMDGDLAKWIAFRKPVDSL